MKKRELTAMVLTHMIIGGAVGYILLHPISKLIQNLLVQPQPVTYELFTSSFKLEHLAMAYYYMFLGAITGIAVGYFAYKYRVLKKISTTDALTGVYNRRYFNKRLGEEVDRSLRHRRPLALLMIDIDYFKNYNDKNGHQAGDVLLQKLSKILTETARQYDVVTRYGGEEFAVIVPETNRKGAEKLAERMRANVENFPFMYREKQPQKKVTISIGLADIPTHAQSKTGLVEKADTALYCAKDKGRNRVESAKAAVTRQWKSWKARKSKRDRRIGPDGVYKLYQKIKRKA